MTEEKRFETKIKAHLKGEKIPFVKYFANGFTKSGVPDVLSCCNGYTLAIEVKAKNGRPSELQKHSIKEINDANGYAVILYPNQFDDFKRLVDHLQNGCTCMARTIVEKINERWTI